MGKSLKFQRPTTDQVTYQHKLLDLTQYTMNNVKACHNVTVTHLSGLGLNIGHFGFFVLGEVLVVREVSDRPEFKRGMNTISTWKFVGRTDGGGFFSIIYYSTVYLHSIESDGERECAAGRFNGSSARRTPFKVFAAGGFMRRSLHPIFPSHRRAEHPNRPERTTLVCSI